MTEPQGRDWYDWHQGYEPDSGSHLRRRLQVVRDLLGRALDERGPGPIVVASLCAGQGDDLFGVLEIIPGRATSRRCSLNSMDGTQRRSIAAPRQPGCTECAR